jgi:hypothetical protein
VTNGGTSKPKISSQVPRVEGSRCCPSLLSILLPVCRVSEWVSRPPSSPRSLIMKISCYETPLIPMCVAYPLPPTLYAEFMAQKRTMETTPQS